LRWIRRLQKDGWSSGRCGRIEETAWGGDVDGAEQPHPHVGGDQFVLRDEARAQEAKRVAQQTVLVTGVGWKRAAAKTMGGMIVSDGNRIGVRIVRGVSPTRRPETEDRREESRDHTGGATRTPADGHEV
jgi:hypothetical protein